MVDCKISAVWTVKEKIGGIYVPVLETRNIFTDYGRTALAHAIQGTYASPAWLALDTYNGALTATASAGATSVNLSQSVDLAGDTQLVLSPGKANQETVTFSSVSSAVYTLSTPLTQTHTIGDAVVRLPLATDTISTIRAEVIPDSVNNPTQRLGSSVGYSGGAGNWIAQFYMTGTQGLFYIASAGLVDTPIVSTGNLHNHFTLGYNHTSGNDVEIDGSLTITN